MYKIIDGKRYNTKTAIWLAELPSCDYMSDLEWHDTSLYVTKTGQFFIVGRGNAASMWAKKVSHNSWGAGGGLRLVTKDKAQEILESAGETELLEEYFTPVDG